MTTDKKLANSIGFIANVPPSQIQASTHIREDLNLDPIDYLLLIAELETAMGIYLKAEEIETIETVRDLALCLDRNVAVAA